VTGTVQCSHTLDNSATRKQGMRSLDKHSVCHSLGLDDGPSGPLPSLADGVCFGAGIGKLLYSTTPAQLRASLYTLHCM
jgi:hypothetical protein